MKKKRAERQDPKGPGRGQQPCCSCRVEYHQGGWVCFGCGLPPWHCNTESDEWIKCNCLLIQDGDGVP